MQRTNALTAAVARFETTAHPSRSCGARAGGTADCCVSATC
jgi:hypothetical protein